MGRNFTHNPRKIYYVVVLIWAILLVTVMSGIVAVDLQRAEKKFAEHANMHFLQANDRVQINEAVLEGFAVMSPTALFEPPMIALMGPLSRVILLLRTG